MNYSQATAYLDGFVNFERLVPGQHARTVMTLDRVRELARRMGDPQDRFPVLHVAGTKGKGSTCAFADSILRAAGFKTALYTSPHLQTVRERIQINGVMISEADFARLLEQSIPVIEAMRSPPQGERGPTYFEVLTHLAMAWFAEQNVDVAIVEVGLGGRLDATNIVKPLACAITSISMDHQAVLGKTIEEIAREKAGIIKSGVPVVSAPQRPEVLAVIKEYARAAGSRLYQTHAEIEGFAGCGESRTGLRRAIARTMLQGRGEVHAELGLCGAHQAENWAVAVQLADFFCMQHLCAHLSVDVIQRGSRAVEGCGRLEEIVWPGTRCRVILDGAHNDYSLRIILNEVCGTGTGTVVLFGCAKDKDVLSMLKELARIENLGGVVFTQFGSARGESAAELARAWQNLTGKSPAHNPDCRLAIEVAMKFAGDRGTVLVSGSLYLVGAIKDLNTR